MVLDQEFPPDVRVENEMRSLSEAGYKIYLLTYSRKKSKSYEVYNNIEVYRIPIGKLMYKFSALALLVPIYFHFWYRHINRFMQLHEVDAIHVHDLPLLSVAKKISVEYNVPLIADFHENRPEIMKLYAHTNTLLGKLLISIPRWEAYQKKYSILTDRLILVSPEAKKYYVDKYSVWPQKVYVVPNYADIDWLNKIEINKQIIDKYKSKFMLLYFGDTGTRRGTLTIIETAKKLNDKKNIQFVIIGNSKEQNILKEKIKKYNLSNVELTGYLPFELIVSYIKSSKAGLCPFLRNIHHDTTYANKMFQIMYFGKPVIVSDCTAQAAVINKTKCGLVYEAGNSDKLAEKILLLQQNEELREQFGRNASNAVLSEYNTTKGNRILIQLYESLKMGS